MPATALHIIDNVDNGGSTGNILIESSTNNAGLRLKSDQAGGRDWIVASSGGSAGTPSSFRVIDNSVPTDRLVINGGGNVGIGTTTPGAPLEVSGQNSGNTNRGGIQIDDRGDGCCSQLRMTSGQTIWDTYSASNGLFYIYGVRTHAGTTGVGAIFNITDSGSVGIGTTDPCTNSQSGSITNCKLSVAGAIQAEEVVVNSGWSDYIFDSGYQLKPLDQVAKYIQEHHHLPDIPSAAEVKDKGIKVGEIESKLLAKIEELTLHMIQSEERNKELEDRIAKLESQLNQKAER
jgi:hypothetical protein